MIDRDTFRRMLDTGAQLMLENAERINDIDARFGDGDHGIAVTKIAELVQERTATWGDASIKDFLFDLGTHMMLGYGGSNSMLYGVMIGGLGMRLGEDENKLTADAAKRALSGCLSEVYKATGARVGDKTMIDALAPAVEAALACPAAFNDPASVFAAAADAAEAGAAASEGLVARFGGARTFGAKTIGTPDVGAVSTALFLRGLAQGAAS